MTTWLVTEDQDGAAGWTIWRDGLQVADTAGIREAMVIAEMGAGQALTWRLTASGFESVGPDATRSDPARRAAGADGVRTEIPTDLQDPTPRGE